MSNETEQPWWRRRRDELLRIAEAELNAFVYDPGTILEACDRLTGIGSVDRVLFAMKSNFNADVLRLLAERGIGFECVSPNEVEHLRASVPDLATDRILFTPNFAPRSDYEWARSQGITLTLDNLYPLREWPEVFADLDVFIRIDPDVGRGHHEHVITAGEHSKFGIPRFEVDELVELTRSANVNVVGIHAHSGSGIPEADTWGLVAQALAEVGQRFPNVRVLDLGGGLGVPARPGEPDFDLAGMDAALARVRETYPDYAIWLEPGRYLVSQAGILLTHVTQLKGKGRRRYVGVATGMNALIRPSLYDAYHQIVNLTRIDEPAVGEFTVVGPICETGDTLGVDRELPETFGGDVMLLLNAGAYGRVMSSQYNLRPIPPEIVLPRS